MAPRMIGIGLAAGIIASSGAGIALGQALQVAPLPNSNLKGLKVMLVDDLFTSGDHSDAAAVAEGYWDEFSRNYGFSITKSNRASDFTATNLRNFNLLVINYTQNIHTYLDPSQETALKTYVEAGGSVIGYHTASMPREGDWDWYSDNVIIGSYNPNYHGLRNGRMVKTKDQAVLDLPNSKYFLTGLPDVFQANDEWYAFNQGPIFDEAKVLYYIDESSMGSHTHTNLNQQQMSLPLEKRHPILWYRELPGGKGRIFYTGIIHNAAGARTEFFKLVILRAAELVSGFTPPNTIMAAKMLAEHPGKLRVTASDRLIQLQVEDAGEYTAVLHDLSGKPVRNQAFRTKAVNLDRSGIPKGNYFLQIQSAGMPLATRLISLL